MTTDLKYLAYTAMLTASLWIPYVTAQSMTNGVLKPGNYRDPTQRPLPLWGKRADRAYLNAVEAFAPFAALACPYFVNRHKARSNGQYTPNKFRIFRLREYSRESEGN